MKKISNISTGLLSIVMPLLLLFTLFSAFVEKEEEAFTDLQRLKLKGKVKSILETRYTPAGDESGGTVASYKKYTLFNPDGFETEYIIYNNNGKSSKVYYEFDTAGHKSGYKEYDDQGTLWNKVTYKLDKDGNKVEADYDWLEKGGYDEIREKSEQLYELLDRHPWDIVLYENDYRGAPLEEEYRKKDGAILFKFEYKYDIQGNVKAMTYFNIKGRTSWETKYKYNRDNVLTASTIYKSNRVAAESEYSYQTDSQGNWTSRTETREVYYNILTRDLVEGTFLIERIIEYYP